MESRKNLKSDRYPFRKVAATSFILGGLFIILGVILLLSIKSDFKLGYSMLAIEKMAAGIAFLGVGINYFFRGYQYEYSFNLEEIFDPAHGANIGYLLGHRTNGPQQTATEYATIMHSESFSLSSAEKEEVNNVQSLFYKLLSKRDFSRTYDFLPYPITKFTEIQSRPLVILSAFCILFLGFLFLVYLEIITLQMTWLNLFILSGLLSIWRPAKIDNVIERNRKEYLRNKLVFFIVFFLITILLYRPYADQLNMGLFISILLLASVVMFTAVLSFRLIGQVFGSREVINVSVSSIAYTNHRTSTQPNNILQQFENTLRSLTGWYFRSKTEDAGGYLAGDQNRKGDFKFEYVYETQPKLFSTEYDEKSEKLLKKIWRGGTGLACVGIILIFAGIISIPRFDTALILTNPESVYLEYAPKILLNLFLAILGIAIYFFGKKLVYEVFLFFNTEVFFESNLILFGAFGNYDEFEQIIGNIKRKDTATDFTPDIKVCKVISSVFMHPYLQKGSLQKRERFVVKIMSDNSLFNKILQKLRENMGSYMEGSIFKV